MRESVLHARCIRDLASEWFLNGPARGRENQRVDRLRIAALQALVAAECSLSTGSRSPPPRFRAASARSPAATRLSLFASASVTPCSSAHRVAPTPAKPTTAFSTRSGSRGFQERGQVTADLDVLDAVLRRASSSSGCEPEASANNLELRVTSTISSACRPIEPVAPSNAIRLRSVATRERLTGGVFRRRYARPIERSLHRYGDDASQLGELFVPDSGGSHAVVVVIHGGSLEGPLGSLVDDGTLRRPRRQGSRCLEPGIPACRERRRVAGDVRRRRSGGRPTVRARRPRSISGELARSDTVQAATLRCGRRHVRRSRATPPAPRRASVRAPSSRRRVGRPSPGRRHPACGRARHLALMGGSPEEHPERYALASPRERLPLGVDQLVLHGDADRECRAAHLRLLLRCRAGARRSRASCESCPAQVTSSTSIASTEAWHTAATGWSGSLSR